MTHVTSLVEALVGLEKDFIRQHGRECFEDGIGYSRWYSLQHEVDEGVLGKEGH